MSGLRGGCVGHGVFSGVGRDSKLFSLLACGAYLFICCPHLIHHLSLAIDHEIDLSSSHCQCVLIRYFISDVDSQVEGSRNTRPSIPF